jgi:hypothetical protein
MQKCDAQGASERYVARENVRRFEKLLSLATAIEERQHLQSLLTEARSKLEELVARFSRGHQG